jgi:hypothetical protein
MKLNVPYYSQKIDVKDSEWKNRACGIVCLKMVLDFTKPESKETLDIAELIKIGVEMGAYGPSGWIHQGLVDIAAKSNLSIYRKEFKSDNFGEEQDMIDDGVKKIIKSLMVGDPVLVSAVKKFKYKDKFHMVVLVGFEGDENNFKGFYYHDPDAGTVEEGEGLFISIEIFQKYWRKMAIFIHQ